MTVDISPYLAGKKLYGDDFTPDAIREWFCDEAEGYADLGAHDPARYAYAYHELNRFHAFSHLTDRAFEHALGIGSAYGDEFRPIASRIRTITILDPSDAFSGVNAVLGVPCTYRKPCPSGSLAFPANSFDLITSLGVMHHIPNVSYVMQECHRCLAPNGVMLLREPISSMGDWRVPRAGLTKRERGIPLPLLERIVTTAGFTIVKKSLCHFPALAKVAKRIGVSTYNHPIATRVDALLSRAFAWNVSYHRTTVLQKLAPASVFLVLSKP